MIKSNVPVPPGAAERDKTARTIFFQDFVDRRLYCPLSSLDRVKFGKYFVVVAGGADDVGQNQVNY